MAEGLSWEQVGNPGYLFAQGAPFVERFGAERGAHHINPVTHPMAYAEAVAELNPRHPRSVFRKPGDTPEAYEDRYVIADNGMPAWAAPYEEDIYHAAHGLGVRDQEIGTTFAHPFPEGRFAVGLVLEGANRQNKLRGAALAEAVRAGRLSVDQMFVAGTSRPVGEREGHGNYNSGHAVAAKAVAELYDEYPDVFGRGGVPLDVFRVETRQAGTRETVSEVALRLGASSLVMAGSNIYGSWMRTDLLTVQHRLPRLTTVGFGAGPDDPKAARTPLIWAAEVAQTLVSAAHLQAALSLK